MKTLHIPFLFIFIFLSSPVLSQEKDYPDTPEERILYVRNLFDTIPPIICNEKEISPEEFSRLDIKRYGTCIFLKIKQLATELAGERGKCGLIYIHDKKDYFPQPSSNGYFRGGDFPAEFSEGKDSLFSFIRCRQIISDDVLKSDLDGETMMSCFFDETGKLVKCEAERIELSSPLDLTVFLKDGAIPRNDLLGKKKMKILEEIIHSAQEVTRQLPPFKPAYFYLRNVKYRLDLYIPIK